MSLTCKEPKLRFKEFSENLLNIRMKDIILLNTYGPRFNANDYHQNGNVKTIRGTDVSVDGNIKYKQVPLANLDNNFIENHLLKDGDLVMITTADCGLTGIFKQQEIKYIPSAYAIKIRFNNTCYPLYFKYFFQTSLATKEINKYIRKATVSNLPASDIGRIKINLPQKQEQEKIASFLSEVDEKIESLTCKEKLLQKYKKGVMQKIFNQEIRFKADDGSEYPKLEEKRLNEIAEINPKIKTLPATFTYIDLESVEKGLLIKENSILKIDAPSRAQRLLQPKDILFQTVRPYQQNNLHFQLAGNYVASTGYAQIRAHGSSSFLYQVVHTRKILNEVISRCTGTSFPAISSSDLSFIKVDVPCLEEQTKIANFLSTIDEKLLHVKKQLESTKEFKKALLQQMFV